MNRVNNLTKFIKSTIIRVFFLLIRTLIFNAHFNLDEFCMLDYSFLLICRETLLIFLTFFITMIYLD
jgi:hypothetical protein